MDIVLIERPSRAEEDTSCIVNAIIDTARTGAPVSSSIYGQFLAVGETREVPVEGPALSAIPNTVEAPPFSVNCDSHPAQ